MARTTSIVWPRHFHLGDWQRWQARGLIVPGFSAEPLYVPTRLMDVPSTPTEFRVFPRHDRINRSTRTALAESFDSYCAGMVHAWVSRHSIDRGLSTEAAPNSYTGSGQAALPRTDGVPSVPPQPPGRAKVRPPETSPCHALAKQSGELDPAGDAPRGADPSPHRERRKAWVVSSQCM